MSLDETVTYVSGPYPDVQITAQAHVYSPRLAHPEEAADFAKQIIEVSADAEL